MQNSEVTDEDHYVLTKEDEFDWMKYLSQCEIVWQVEKGLCAQGQC